MQNKYEVIGVVGEGAYGIVYKCRNKQTNKFVAIKKFKEIEDDLVKKTMKRELKMLQKLSHPNIVAFYEAFKRKGNLFLVFEYIEKNLLEVLQDSPEGLDPKIIKTLIYQLCKAVSYLHNEKIIHRDIKPENLLINKNYDLKLCDFGFARYINFSSKLTDYVATRWYRAPELLLTQGDYNNEIDFWSIGCIMGELVDGNPLFPGENEIDQLNCIQKILGKFNDEQINLFYKNPLFNGKNLDDVGKPETLEKRYLGKLSKVAISFMKGLLDMDPKKRLNGNNVFLHPYLNKMYERDLEINEEKENYGENVVVNNNGGSNNINNFDGESERMMQGNFNSGNGNNVDKDIEVENIKQQNLININRTEMNNNENYISPNKDNYNINENLSNNNNNNNIIMNNNNNYNISGNIGFNKNINTNMIKIKQINIGKPKQNINIINKNNQEKQEEENPNINSVNINIINPNIYFPIEANNIQENNININNNYNNINNNLQKNQNQNQNQKEQKKKKGKTDVNLKNTMMDNAYKTFYQKNKEKDIYNIDIGLQNFNLDESNENMKNYIQKNCDIIREEENSNRKNKNMNHYKNNNPNNKFKDEQSPGKVKFYSKNSSPPKNLYNNKNVYGKNFHLPYIPKATVYAGYNIQTYKKYK